jgi:ElaB/YqjD/DUF883 family membrane-anchored ribosome-binding protein
MTLAASQIVLSLESIFVVASAGLASAAAVQVDLKQFYFGPPILYATTFKWKPVRTLWCEHYWRLPLKPHASWALFRLQLPREFGYGQKEDCMGEATDPEKVARQAKERMAGAIEDLKETATPIADAAQPAARGAWNDTKGELSRLRSIGEGYVREKPIQTLLVLFGIGILVGLLVR